MELVVTGLLCLALPAMFWFFWRWDRALIEELRTEMTPLIATHRFVSRVQVPASWLSERPGTLEYWKGRLRFSANGDAVEADIDELEDIKVAGPTLVWPWTPGLSFRFRGRKYKFNFDPQGVPRVDEGGIPLPVVKELVRWRMVLIERRDLDKAPLPMTEGQ